MKKLFYILSCFILLLVTTNSIAKINRYQINLIIFTHITRDALYSEHWPNWLKTPVLKNAIELSTLNPGKNTKLQKEANALKKSSDYQVIINTSWQQPITHLRKSGWIHIEGGQMYDADGQPITNTDDTSIKPAFWELNGKIKISKANYFDIYTRLYLTLPESIIGGEADNERIGNYQPIPLRTFTLFQHQRASTKTLNYIDHPLFGALIKITPVTTPN